MRIYIDSVLVYICAGYAGKLSYQAKGLCIRLFAFEVDEQDLMRAEDEFAEDKDIVWIDHPRYKSCIIKDLDGHSIELYVDKSD